MKINILNLQRTLTKLLAQTYIVTCTLLTLNAGFKRILECMTAYTVLR